jgi:hypothetical protein
MLHKRKEEPIFVPSEGQRNPLCSNRGSSRCPSLDVSERRFSDDTVESLHELGEVLMRIHKRLVSEGYTIGNGKISK